jgi:hypothetical protein
MPAEEIGFQWIVGADARHAIDFTLIRDRIDGFRCGEGGYEMHLVLEDQILRDLGGAVWIGLAVLDDEFQGVDGAVDLDRIVQRLPAVVERPGHFLVEQRQRTRLRGNKTDFDGRWHAECRSSDRHSGGAGG